VLLRKYTVFGAEVLHQDVWRPAPSGAPSGGSGRAGNWTFRGGESKPCFSRQAVYLTVFFFRGEVLFL
jgi:hypothetical protein